jgi:transcriptional regulator with XRE-family HTH domain
MGTLVVLAQQALGMTQETFGELLGVSRATIVRWSGGRFPGLIPVQVQTLVRAVHAVDEGLAVEIAAADHETLESLGIVAPAQAAPAAPPTPVVHPAHLIDSVVCAAADAVGQLPSALRPSLLAAFERANAVGLSMDDVVKGLKGRK